MSKCDRAVVLRGDASHVAGKHFRRNRSFIRNRVSVELLGVVSASPRSLRVRSVAPRKLCRNVFLRRPRRSLRFTKRQQLSRLAQALARAAQTLPEYPRTSAVTPASLAGSPSLLPNPRLQAPAELNPCYGQHRFRNPSIAISPPCSHKRLIASDRVFSESGIPLPRFRLLQRTTHSLPPAEPRGWYQKNTDVHKQASSF